VIQLEENRTTTIELTNLVKPTLKILKVDSITKNPVAHAKFQIWRASGETKTGDYHDLGTFYSDENGEIVLEHTDPGWFKISELEAPSGYSIKQADHEFYLAAGEEKTVQVENIPLSALVVYKYDRISGEPVEGAIFQIRYIRELDAAQGYELDKEYKTVYVQPGKTVEFEWENVPITGQFQLRKYAAEYNEVTGTPAGAPLKGAVYENGGWCKGQGSYHFLIPNAAKAWGLNVEGCKASEPQRILDALSQGKLVVAIMGRGHFTTSGHFIVLRGVQDGKILVADPASTSRSRKAWELSIILNEAGKRAGAGGPFWLIG